MADREEDLRNLTHKGLELPRRIFMTLTDDGEIARAFARLITHLRQKDLISDEEIDNLLLEAVAARRVH